MCGIIGYVGSRSCKEMILSGLERLEYRGYDSAGIALMDHGGARLELVRAVGNLAVLRGAVGTDGSPATTGLGHTRWATHGGVTVANAHPQVDAEARVAVAMNGIIENYMTRRGALAGEGVAVRGEADTQVLPHLIARE